MIKRSSVNQSNLRFDWFFNNFIHNSSTFPNTLLNTNSVFVTEFLTTRFEIDHTLPLKSMVL